MLTSIDSLKSIPSLTLIGGKIMNSENSSQYINDLFNYFKSKNIKLELGEELYIFLNSINTLQTYDSWGNLSTSYTTAEGPTGVQYDAKTRSITLPSEITYNDIAFESEYEAYNIL